MIVACEERMVDKNPIIIDWGLKPLHDKMLEMLKDLHAFCMQYDIEYCLAYGSALGALRHEGFIPWDDDVDIYMTANSYEMFKKQFSINGDKSKYFFQEIDPIDGMVTLSKVRMNNTTYIEPDFRDSGCHQGIYIDIFILHEAPSSFMKKRLMCFANQYLVLKGLSNRRYKRKTALIPLLELMRLFPRDFLRRGALQTIYQIGEADSGLFFDNDLRTYKKSFFCRELVFPARLCDFEDTKLYVPGHCEEYLKKVYGNYMAIPDYETINRAQHAEVWDVENNYTKYL